MAYSILTASILFSLILFSGVDALESEPYEYTLTTQRALLVLSFIIPILAVAFYVALGAGWCAPLCVKEGAWYLQLWACVFLYCPIPFIVCGQFAFRNKSLCVLCWCITLTNAFFLGCLTLAILLCCVHLNDIISRNIPTRGEAWNRFTAFLRRNRGPNNDAEVGGAGAAAPGNNPEINIPMRDM